jgi:hypothetical protein
MKEDQYVMRGQFSTMAHTCFLSLPGVQFVNMLIESELTSQRAGTESEWYFDLAHQIKDPEW